MDSITLAIKEYILENNDNITEKQALEIAEGIKIELCDYTIPYAISDLTGRGLK